MTDSPFYARLFPRAAGTLVLVVLAALTLGSTALASPKDKARWDSKYNADKFLFGRQPIPFLKKNVDLLPKGKTLDLAMGEGRNGVFLATQGFEVTGLDISAKGLEKAHRLAKEHGVTISTHAVDLETYELKEAAYDTIICTYYLQHSLFPKMKDALRSGGMVLVETYTLGHLKYRPRFRKEYLIKANELLKIFEDFKILRYQDVDDGNAAYASIIAQKP